MLKTVQLGQNCGMQVSRLCLGTMNFGEPGRGHQGDWTLGIDAARPIFKAAIDKGLFYFDCADVYGVGASEQVVGALLVLSVLVTPAAAALRISSSPVVVPVLSTAFALVSLVGGILLALGSSVPISPYVTTISFLIYLVCRVASARRSRRARSRRQLVGAVS